MSFALVTDSTCDLSPAVAEQLGIHVVPLRVKLEQGSYLDWLELDPDQVYEHLRRGVQVQTQPPPPRHFEELYLELLGRHDFVVSVHISAQQSETLQNARQAVAARGLGAQVLLIDSGMSSVGLTETVLAVREVLLAGGDADAAQLVAQQVRRTICCQFTVPTLEYLRRGGRVSRSQEMVGTLLGVRPVMGFEDGRIRVERTVRQGQALQDIIRTLEERFGREPISISVAHGGRDPGRMAELRAAVERSRLNPVRRRVQLVGATIGAHVGPGFYGVSALPLSVTERVIGGLRAHPEGARRLGRH